MRLADSVCGIYGLIMSRKFLFLFLTLMFWIPVVANADRLHIINPSLFIQIRDLCIIPPTHYLVSGIIAFDVKN